MIGSNLAILALAVVVAPQIEGSDNLQRSLTITTLTLVVVGLALYLFAFFTSEERVERGVATVTLRETVTTVRQNKALVVLCLSSLAFLVGMFSLQTVAIYYARDVLGDSSYYIVLTVVQTAGTFAGALLFPRLVGVIGKKYTYISAGVVAIVGGIGVALAPASVPTIAIVLFGVFGFGLGGANTMSWALQADTVEYGEWKTSFRTEGATYSLFSFTRKVGQAIGAAASYAIALGGYAAAAEPQSDSAVTAIKVAAGGVPAVVILIAISVMAAYPIAEDRFRRMLREIAERRATRGFDETLLQDDNAG